MLKKCRKIMMLSLLCAIILVMTQSVSTAAGAIIMVKVPASAQVFVKGVQVDEKNLVKVETETGRIHQIAASQLGLTCGTKQYMLANILDPSEIVVYDHSNHVISPMAAEVGFIEYSNVNADFANQVTDRVQKTAIAFHNRVGGYGGGDFGNYFLPNSDAYIKIAASDQGRKWGQTIRAGVIVSATASDIHQYSENAFTATVTVHATSGRGYEEVYDLHLLFQKSGNAFYATHFTYMP